MRLSRSAAATFGANWRDWLRAALKVSQRSTITAIEYMLMIASTMATTSAGHFIF